MRIAFCRGVVQPQQKISLDVILHPRPRAFDSVELLCARKKGTGVKNDSIYAVFLKYGKIKQAKETLYSQGAFPGEEFTTIRNIEKSSNLLAGR